MSDQEKLFILVLQGTVRPGRRSIDVARLVTKLGDEQDEIRVELVDPAEYEFPKDGNDEEVKDPRYSALTKRADGFFVVVPEYNHGYPGTLKRMLDSELENYIHKPVAFAGVSAGRWGGVRAIEALVPIVREMGMVATFTDVQFPSVGDLFDKDGNLLDEAYIRRVNRTYTELIWMARVLRWGRNNVASQYHEG